MICIYLNDIMLLHSKKLFYGFKTHLRGRDKPTPLAYR